jgi:methylmalonyl-CoA/ethylmalonyl-CoA epimerase
LTARREFVAWLTLQLRGCLRRQGATIIGSGEPRICAQGKPVLFLYPKDFLGTLEQA